MSVSVPDPPGPTAVTVITFVPATSGMSPANHSAVPAPAPVNPRSLAQLTLDTVPPVVPLSVMDAPGATMLGADVGVVMVRDGGWIPGVPVRISTN